MDDSWATLQVRSLHFVCFIILVSPCSSQGALAVSMYIDTHLLFFSYVEHACSIGALVLAIRYALDSATLAFIRCIAHYLMPSIDVTSK